MKKTKKRAFTLVELLVVIAILAVLATVSAVGYLGFTEKAKLSNDQSTIKMLNDNLTAEFSDGKPSSVSEAIQGLYSLGVNYGKLKAYSSDHHYAYNLEKNMFVLLNENDEITYPEDETLVKEDLWGLYFGGNSDNVGTSKYVALTPVTNVSAVANIASKPITIDLNDFYYSVDAKIDNKISLINGGYVKNSNDGEIDASKANEYKKTYNSNSLENKYESVIFDWQMNNGTFYFKKDEVTTFENCLFVGAKDTAVDNLGNLMFYAKGADQKNDYTSKLVFNNCTFTNATWALQTPIKNVEVKNSKFINCISGINLQTATNEVLIENNTFNLLSSDSSGKSAAIMLSENSQHDTTYSMNVTSNNFAKCGTIIRLHSCIYPHLDSIDSQKLIFTNNRMGIIENGYSAKWVSGDPTDQEIITKLNNKLNEIRAVIK